MEEHAIPQNVTDFEFHLVGDMSLKQFGYLSAGLVWAYLLFVLFGKANSYLIFPLMAVSASMGAAFAFLPIQGRPLDHWLVAFLRAIFSPTQRSFKSDLLRVDDPFFKRRLSIYLNASGLLEPPIQPQPSPPPPPQPFPKREAPLPAGPRGEQVPPSSDQLKKTVELAKEAQGIQNEILKTEKELRGIKSAAAVAGADPKIFTQKFQQVLTELGQLNQEASQVSQKLAVVTKTAGPRPSLTSTVKAKSIPTLTLTSTPSIINGIVTDAQDNYVEGAIVVAHDKQGLPVRALKSNKLGQFIAATPLPPGSYTLTVEKDNLVFDTLQLTLTDQVLKPAIIQAKKYN